jgi:molecular chaperone DnaK (HSP70)
LKVPTFFTQAQRAALFDAAFLAGLEPQMVVNELTCGIFMRYFTCLFTAALTYLSTRPMGDEEKQKTIMFVDQGHSHTSAMIAKIEKSAITVLATASNEELGSLR